MTGMFPHRFAEVDISSFSQGNVDGEFGGVFTLKRTSATESSTLATRSIIWRVRGLLLDLTEVSSEYTISNNVLQLELQQDVIVCDVQFLERFSDDNQPISLVLFVATKSGVIFRYEFRHPFDQDTIAQQQMSMFSSNISQHRQQVVLPHGSVVSKCSVFSHGKVALCFGSAAFMVAAVHPQLGASEQVCVTFSEGSSVRKFISDLLYRSGPQYTVLDVLGVHTTYIFALCSDGMIRVWTLAQSLIATYDFLSSPHRAAFAAGTLVLGMTSIQACPITEEEAWSRTQQLSLSASFTSSQRGGGGGRTPRSPASPHLSRDGEDEEPPRLFLIYYSSQDLVTPVSLFQLLEVNIDNSPAPAAGAQLAGSELSVAVKRCLPGLPHPLLASICTGTSIWALSGPSRQEAVLYTCSLNLTSVHAADTGGWQRVTAERDEHATVYQPQDALCPVTDAQGISSFYLSRTFKTGRFPMWLIQQTCIRWQAQQQLSDADVRRLVEQEEQEALRVRAAAVAVAAQEENEVAQDVALDLTRFLPLSPQQLLVRALVHVLAHGRQNRALGGGGGRAGAGLSWMKRHADDAFQGDDEGNKEGGQGVEGGGRGALSILHGCWREFLLACELAWSRQDTYCGLGLLPLHAPLSPADMDGGMEIEGCSSSSSPSCLTVVGIKGSGVVAVRAKEKHEEGVVLGEGGKVAISNGRSSSSSASSSAQFLPQEQEGVRKLLACCQLWQGLVSLEDTSEIFFLLDQSLMQVDDVADYIAQWLNPALFNPKGSTQLRAQQRRCAGELHAVAAAIGQQSWKHSLSLLLSSLSQPCRDGMPLPSDLASQHQQDENNSHNEDDDMIGRDDDSATMKSSCKDDASDDDCMGRSNYSIDTTSGSSTRRSGGGFKKMHEQTAATSTSQQLWLFGNEKRSGGAGFQAPGAWSSSALGTMHCKAVCGYYRQIVTSRYNTVRSLVVFLVYLTRCGRLGPSCSLISSLSPEDRTFLSLRALPLAISLLQSLWVSKWLSEQSLPSPAVRGLQPGSTFDLPSSSSSSSSHASAKMLTGLSHLHLDQHSHHNNKLRGSHQNNTHFSSFPFPTTPSWSLGEPVEVLADLFQVCYSRDALSSSSSFLSSSSSASSVLSPGTPFARTAGAGAGETCRDSENLLQAHANPLIASYRLLDHLSLHRPFVPADLDEPAVSSSAVANGESMFEDEEDGRSLRGDEQQQAGAMTETRVMAVVLQLLQRIRPRWSQSSSSSSSTPLRPDLVAGLTLIQQFLAFSGFAETAMGWYIQGLLHFDLQQYGKAKDGFLKASVVFDVKSVSALDSSQTRLRRMLPGGPVQYHTNMMKLFETARQPFLCLTFAYAAMSHIPPAVTSVPSSSSSFPFSSSSSHQDVRVVLFSSIFTHALSLQNYDQAYTAVISVPHQEMRRHCLRRFVIVLVQNQKIQQLCSWPWLDLRQEVEDILWWRAKTSSLLEFAAGGGEGMKQAAGGSGGHAGETINFYEVLYAFVMAGQNYRVAAEYMYHYALRCEREADISHVHMLLRQANALTLVINCLSLLDPLTAASTLISSTTKSAGRGEANRPPSHAWLMVEDSAVTGGAELGVYVCGGGGGGKSQTTQRKTKKQNGGDKDGSNDWLLSAHLPDKKKQKTSKQLQRGPEEEEDEENINSSNWVTENAYDDNEEEEMEESGDKEDEDVDLQREGGKLGLRIVTIDHLRQQHALCRARIELACWKKQTGGVGGTDEEDQDRIAFQTSPQDTLGLLVHAGLMDSAVSLALLFNLSLTVVFSSLTDKCIALQRATDTAGMRAVQLHIQDTWGGKPPSMMGVSAGGAQGGEVREKQAAAWWYLQRLLQQYDRTDNNFSYRVVVVRTMLASDAKLVLPRWLTELFSSSDEKSSSVNGSRLLPLFRLLAQYHRMSELVNLALPFLQEARRRNNSGVVAAAAAGKKQQALSWVPYSFFEELLAQLKEDACYPRNRVGVLAGGKGGMMTASTAVELHRLLSDELKQHVVSFR